MSLQITQKLIPVSRYDWKSYTTMNPIGVCIHNTANEASAENEVSYMTRVNEKKSYHYAVDDIQAIQALPENRTAWHAGDNLGQGNMKYIAIEICYSLPKKLPADQVYAKFDKAEKNAVELVVQILKRYGWGIEQVKKHQDFSGKYCPHRTLDLGWDRFLNMIKEALNPTPVPQPVDWRTEAIKLPVKTEYELIRDTALFNIDTGERVKEFKKGDRLNLDYQYKNFLLTAWSFDRKIKNGFRLEDLTVYTAPQPDPVPEPPSEPETPEEPIETPETPPVEPEPPTEEPETPGEDPVVEPEPVGKENILVYLYRLILRVLVNIFSKRKDK